MLWKKSRGAVRPAKKKDLEPIGALRRQLHELHRTGRPDVFQKPFGEALDKQTRQMYYNKNGLMFVAEAEGTVCAFAAATFVTEPSTPVWDNRSYCRIEEIVVDKSLRGQGYGTLLMQAVRREALARGCPKLELNVWAFNAGACAFWTKQGFTPYLYCLESPVQPPDAQNAETPAEETTE